MKTRIISGLIMAPLLIVLYLGGWFLWAAALIIAVMGIHEFCNGWENLGVHPSKPVCYTIWRYSRSSASSCRWSVSPARYCHSRHCAVWVRWMVMP